MIITWTNLVDLESSKPIFNLKAFLVQEKKIFKCFLPYMGLAAIVFNDAEPFEQIFNTLLTEGTM